MLTSRYTVGDRSGAESVVPERESCRVAVMNAASTSPGPALPSLVGGFLPVGRYRCDQAAVQSMFVDDPMFVASSTRAKIWGDWERVTAVLRSQVPVCAAWLGGSFTTSKLDPSDVDVIYVIEDEIVDFARATDPRASAVLDVIVQNLARCEGYGIDTYLLPWRVNPERGPRDSRDRTYAFWRGYWDDFWLRTLSGPKTMPRVRADALPRRGYLEVILDGYKP